MRPLAFAALLVAVMTSACAGPAVVGRQYDEKARLAKGAIEYPRAWMKDDAKRKARAMCMSPVVQYLEPVEVVFDAWQEDAWDPSDEVSAPGAWSWWQGKRWRLMFECPR